MKVGIIFAHSLHCIIDQSAFIKCVFQIGPLLTKVLDTMSSFCIALLIFVLVLLLILVIAL